MFLARFSEIRDAKAFTVPALLVLAALALPISVPTALAADAPTVGLAWQSDPIRPPDFEGFFPKDPEAGARLDALHRAPDRDLHPDEEILSTVRAGFRTTREHRTLVLAWIGNRYIWGRDPQNPHAIEIMYHAIASPDHETAHYAIYFGLSVVKSKPPAVLETLAAFAMGNDDPNNLDRIAWGCSDQRDELLARLAPRLALPDGPEREKAVVLDKIFSGKLKAFKWAGEKAVAEAEKTWGKEMPALKERLLNGSEADRRDALKTLLHSPAGTLMDEGYLPGFAAFADDPDARLRAEVARTALGRWIWNAEKQSDEAVALAMKFSRDADAEVRGRAIYFGLSTIRNPSTEVMARMVELLLDPPAPDAWGRLLWAMRRNRSQAESSLKVHLDTAEGDPQRALRALMAYRELTEHDPPGMELLAPVLASAPHLIVLAARDSFKPADPRELWDAAASSIEPDAGSITERRWMADETGVYILLRVNGRPAFSGLHERLKSDSKIAIKHGDLLTPEHEARMRGMEKLD